MADESNVTTTQAGEGTQAAQQTAAQASTEPAKQQEYKPDSNLERLIQQAVDRATHKLGNDNKKLRQENERMKREKMSDDEIKQLEMQEQKKAIDERDKALTEK